MLLDGFIMHTLGGIGGSRGWYIPIAYYMQGKGVGSRMYVKMMFLQRSF